MASSAEAVSPRAMADHPVRGALLLGALGVVFGDIGTSPIYAFREALRRFSTRPASEPRAALSRVRFVRIQTASRGWTVEPPGRQGNWRASRYFFPNFA
jgi:hypothetical protein